MADTYEFLDYTGLSEFAEIIKAKLIENSVAATATDGATYTATVDGLTALTPGAVITIIPSMTATSTTPTLNVNSLGAKQIRRKLSGGTLTRPQLMYANVVYKDLPLLLMYDGTYWVATQFTKPSATDLYGMVGVPNGGTGLDSVTAGNFLVGNGTEDLVEKTPAQVLEAIGAAPDDHSHSVTDLTDAAQKIYYADTSRTANTVLAAPNGSNGTASFRKLDEADLPSHKHNYIEVQYGATGADLLEFALSCPASSITPFITSSSTTNTPPCAENSSRYRYSPGYVIKRYDSTVIVVVFAYDGGPCARNTYKDTAWSGWEYEMSSRLSTELYGTTLPSTATNGRIFFKKVT